MMKSMLAATLLLAAGLIQAQVPNMEPPVELKQLDWMMGTWVCPNMKMEMEGMAMEGPMTYKLERSGQFIKGSSTWDAEGMKMTDEGFIGWDAEKNKFISWTFTNMAPVPRIEWGEVRGDSVIWTSEPWSVDPAAPPTQSRATITKVSPTQAKFVLEFKGGDEWQKVAEATFSKK